MSSESLTIKPSKEVFFKQVENDQLKLDLFFPPNHDVIQSIPAIVFFFGGGWKNGSTIHFHRQANHLSQRGMVAVCAQYRTESSHGVQPKICVQDAKSAMRYVRRHSSELGIDPSRIAAGGGSAGGHLAAATALLNGLDESGEDLSISCKPNALVLFNPVFSNGPDGYGYDRVEPYWEEFSPHHNIAEGAPPTTVFMGTEDKLTSVETTNDYKAKMEAVGSRCDVHFFEGEGHGFFNENKYSETLELADAFLVDLGYLSSLAQA